jgi:hypothetical protein
MRTDGHRRHRRVPWHTCITCICKHTLSFNPHLAMVLSIPRIPKSLFVCGICVVIVRYFDDGIRPAPLGDDCRL